MFNIFSHQRNENQNYFEIPSHLSQNGYHQGNNNKSVEDVVGGRNLYMLLAGM
jgi:hypothetical protein